MVLIKVRNLFFATVILRKLGNYLLKNPGLEVSSLSWTKNQLRGILHLSGFFPNIQSFGSAIILK
ncbi:hypothetical protein BpJC7_20890 [Weizmannia acidilactici]|uniref:Uncharacterized protein n=1 Tax=Weizmannia acidilactici TaxID=2607726 RepID=A0A5J4J783_9BACI|nr:hypothetical protein BpJC4_25160 [Weizmannia acidilactici]GER70786.1 hypothetical protein BpJC7_20890 [Weizmannia acidilactici]GER74350.1 hypothetical protein BpPP18_24170 [Weizmannia acidilactici]